MLCGACVSGWLEGEEEAGGVGEKGVKLILEKMQGEKHFEFALFLTIQIWL